MKNLFIAVGAVLFGASSAAGQALPNRYRADVFPTVNTTSGVVFSTTIPHVSTFGIIGGGQLANEETFGNVRVTLRMDIYQPQGDTLTKRPVIIFCFGGGFIGGQRTSASMVALARDFARRGYVTAAIDYRLGMNLTDPEKAKRAVYRAIQDSRSAVRFFRANAATYRVDPNQVFVSGHSSGGFTAFHNVYLDKESERPASTFTSGRMADLGTLDGIGDNKTDANGNPISGKANGAMGFAGALADPNLIEGPADVPVSMFHSSDDRTVLYNSGEPFTDINFLPGLNLPIVSGGNALSARATAAGAPHIFYPYTNRGHDVHFNKNTNALYPDIVPRGSGFFYDTRLKPSAASIVGASSVCTSALTQTYTVNGGAAYYDYRVVGGTIQNRNPRSNTVTVAWSRTATTRTLTVTPYSRQLAQGADVSLNVTTAACATREALVASAYPNPASDRLYVQLTDQATEATSIQLVDKFGNEVGAKLTASPNGKGEQVIDLSQVPAGIYVLRVGTATESFTQRIVKQ